MSPITQLTNITSISTHPLQIVLCCVLFVLSGFSSFCFLRNDSSRRIFLGSQHIWPLDCCIHIFIHNINIYMVLCRVSLMPTESNCSPNGFGSMLVSPRRLGRQVFHLNVLCFSGLAKMDPHLRKMVWCLCLQELFFLLRWINCQNEKKFKWKHYCCIASWPNHLLCCFT